VRDCIDHPIKPEADNRRLVDCVHCTFISVSFLTCLRLIPTLNAFNILQSSGSKACEMCDSSFT
jgi:hypothetical protein